MPGDSIRSNKSPAQKAGKTSNSREEFTWTDAILSPGAPQQPRPSPCGPLSRRTHIRPTPLPSSIRSRRAAPPTLSAGRWRPLLEPILKQPCIIETKAGAAGQVGGQVAATAKPDGYTLLIHIVSISGFAEVDKLFGRQPKFTRADFIPIARLTSGPMVLLVNDQQPYKSSRNWSTTPRQIPTS